MIVKRSKFAKIEHIFDFKLVSSSQLELKFIVIEFPFVFLSFGSLFLKNCMEAAWPNG